MLILKRLNVEEGHLKHAWAHSKTRTGKQEERSLVKRRCGRLFKKSTKIFSGLKVEPRKYLFGFETFRICLNTHTCTHTSSSSHMDQKGDFILPFFHEIVAGTLPTIHAFANVKITCDTAVKLPNRNVKIYGCLCASISFGKKSQYG